MAHPSKRKGNRFERELVEAFAEAGLEAVRAYGSNGEALVTRSGVRCETTVDVLVQGGLKVQAKRRRRVATYLQPPDGAHVTAVREDRGETLVVVPLELFLRLLRCAYTLD